MQAKFDEPETPEYLALKYLFFTPKQGEMRGGFCLLFEGGTGKILLQTVWLTRNNIPIAFKTSEDWRTFGRLLTQLGPFDKVWGDKLDALLPELVKEEDRLALFAEASNPVKQTLLSLEGQICKGFERATHTFLNVDCDVELLTRSELEKAGLLSPQAGSKTDGQDGDKEKSFEGTVIPCLPRVDPVRGKPSSIVAPGDLLEVGLDGDVGASGLIQKHLEATHQAPVFPVEEVDRREDKTYIYLRISDEVRGLLTLTKNLRLKTRQSMDETVKHKGLEDLTFFLMIGVALVGLLFAIRYLFF
jgi:hypothetical protein